VPKWHKNRSWRRDSDAARNSATRFSGSWSARSRSRSRLENGKLGTKPWATLRGVGLLVAFMLVGGAAVIAIGRDWSLLWCWRLRWPRRSFGRNGVWPQSGEWRERLRGHRCRSGRFSSRRWWCWCFQSVIPRHAAPRSLDPNPPTLLSVNTTRASEASRDTRAHPPTTRRNLLSLTSLLFEDHL
jgi:hypothetical protein